MRAARVRARLIFEVGRLVRTTWGFTVAVVFAILLWNGWFPDLTRVGSERGRAAAAAILVAVVVAKIGGRLRATLRRRSPWREAFSDMELGLLLLVSTYVFFAVLGGVLAPVYPMVYGLVCFLVMFHRLAVGIPLTLAAVGLEAIMAFSPSAVPDSETTFAGHVAFIAIFAALAGAFLRGEVALQRRAWRRRLDEEVASMREEARDFRLIATALSGESRVRTRAEEEEKLSQGSIETIHQQLYATLNLLRGSLQLHTCALLWLDAAGDKFKVKELATSAQNFSEDVFLPARTGVLGALLRDAKPFALENPRPSLLPYYQGPTEIAAFLGVPVLEGRTLCGVLIADRVVGAAFTHEEVALVVGAAAQAMRTVQSERVFQAVEKSKHEHERFYQASAALNRALTMDQIYDAAIEGARSASDFDLAVVATYDMNGARHTICRAVGDGAEVLVGTEHCDPASLASMVVKNKQALPAGGEWRERDELNVFDATVRMRGFASLLVIPLLVKDEVIGTFTVAAHRPGAFPRDRREMLGVIANQVAISLQNGHMYQALEEQATTDGLTGLVNHRTFHERLLAMLGRAERHQFKVALITTDIDHFKKVNDTYGHSTGDEVLRRVAAIMTARARKISIVARQGGEEFAMVLEATDRAGATQLAERVRQEVAQQIFESAKGPFTASLSLGVAIFPDDGRSKQELVDHADAALYAAKHSGRNRTVCYAELEKDRARLKAAG